MSSHILSRRPMLPHGMTSTWYMVEATEWGIYPIAKGFYPSEEECLKAFIEEIPIQIFTLPKREGLISPTSISGDEAIAIYHVYKSLLIYVGENTSREQINDYIYKNRNKFIF